MGEAEKLDLLTKRVDRLEAVVHSLPEGFSRLTDVDQELLRRSDSNLEFIKSLADVTDGLTKAQATVGDILSDLVKETEGTPKGKGDSIQRLSELRQWIALALTTLRGLAN